MTHIFSEQRMVGLPNSFQSIKFFFFGEIIVVYAWTSQFRQRKTRKLLQLALPAAKTSIENMSYYYSIEHILNELKFSENIFSSFLHQLHWSLHISLSCLNESWWNYKISPLSISALGLNTFRNFNARYTHFRIKKTWNSEKILVF